MRFVLQTVIEDVKDVEASVRAIITDFHNALAGSGHAVTKATLTKDEGQVDVTPAPPVEPEPVVEQAPVEPVVPVPDEAAPAEVETPTEEAPETPAGEAAEPPLQ